MENTIKLLMTILVLLTASCGTKTIRDNAIQLKGPIVLKFRLSNTDSILHVGDSIIISYTIPSSITTADRIEIKDIEKASISVHPKAYEIDSANNTAYKEHSYNFIKGYGDYSRAAMDINKGVYCEDIYICRDTGVFWFSLTPQAGDFRFWTKDGKQYVIGETETFDVPDMHTTMLLRNVPGLIDQLAYEQSKGFGHYCFKVVP